MMVVYYQFSREPGLRLLESMGRRGIRMEEKVMLGRRHDRYRCSWETGVPDPLTVELIVGRKLVYMQRR